ncbi:hypothetical protein GF362_06060 [Candidatus Dojkabacteria bacterium]|nr:hypothetical protein [Candidatus Dojkabacteria bacterium]
MFISIQILIKRKKEERFSKKVFTNEQSSFISTPEYVAEHVVDTILGLGDFRSAVELCSCVGSTCIQLGRHLDKVVGIEIDEDRVVMARKNAILYGVDNVQFIRGDVLDIKLLKSINADIAFLDPGWSTRLMDRSSHVSDIDSTNPSLRKMFDLTKRHITENIIARIPATFNFGTLKELGKCRLENIIINNELVFKFAYFIGEYKRCEEEDVVFE